MRLILGALTVSSALLMSGCLNIFSPIDSPSGDTQYLSAGQSCLDRGDYACAKDAFSRLSSSSADIQSADTAFTILAQNGAGSGVFIKTFGTGVSNVGAAFNTFSSKFPNANPTLRAAIYTAYQQVQNMKPNTPLRGLVRFTSASAFLAEVLAEGAALTGSLKQADIAAQPANCIQNGTPPLCLTAPLIPQCGGPGSSGSFISGPGKFSAGLDDFITTPNAAGIAGSTPTFDMIYGALTSISNALATNELGGTGSFGGTSASFANQLLGSSFVLNAGIDSPCFRYGLLSLGIGAQ